MVDFFESSLDLIESALSSFIDADFHRAYVDILGDIICIIFKIPFYLPYFSLLIFRAGLPYAVTILCLIPSTPLLTRLYWLLLPLLALVLPLSLLLMFWPLLAILGLLELTALGRIVDMHFVGPGEGVGEKDPWAPPDVKRVLRKIARFWTLVLEDASHVQAPDG
jgi:hypothetical protein